MRAIVPGWYATDSVKWLTRVTVLETRSRTLGVEEYRYRVRARPGRAGG